MEKPKFVYITYITTTPEKLWNALQNSEMTRQYWGNHTNATDWKPGSRWEHRDTDDAKLVDIVGKVVESDPSRKLVLTWASPADEARPAVGRRGTELSIRARERGGSRVPAAVGDQLHRDFAYKYLSVKLPAPRKRRDVAILVHRVLSVARMQLFAQ